MTKKRTKPLVKEVFTDKPAPEVWSDENYKKHLETLNKMYNNSSGTFTYVAKQTMFDQVSAFYDRVVEGSLIVEKA